MEASRNPSQGVAGLSAGIDHPELRALAAYWESRRGGAIPRRRDIDIIDLRPWYGHLAMIEVGRGGSEFHYLVYGTRLAQLRGRDLTGCDTAVLPTEERARLEHEYRHVVRSGHPLYIAERRAVHQPLRPITKLILPLTMDGREVERLLVGLYPLP